MSYQVLQVVGEWLGRVAGQPGSCSALALACARTILLPELVVAALAVAENLLPRRRRGAAFIIHTIIFFSSQHP